MATLLLMQRLRAEAALRESEEKFSTAFHASPAMLVVSALDGRSVEVNQAYLDFTGKSREEVLGKSADLGVTSGEERQRIAALLGQSGGSLRHAEIDLQFCDGRTRHVLVSVDPLSLHGVPHRLSTLVDVTEGIEAKQALIEAADRLSFVIEGTGTGLWDWDLTTNLVRYSREWKRLLGCEDHEVEDRLDEWQRLTHPDDVAPTMARVGAFMERPVGTLRAEFRMRHRDGDYRWILSRAAARFGPNGKPSRLVGLHTDITEQKQAEDQLRRNEEILQLFIEHSPAAIAMFDREMKYLAYSRRFVSDYGLGEQGLVGRSHYEVFPEISEHWKTIHRRCLAGATERAEDDSFPRADGRVDCVQWEIRPWYESDGRIGGIVLFSEVVTERKRVEEELRRLSGRLLQVQDDERRRLARELHDQTAQELAAVAMNLSSLQRLTPNLPENAGALLDETQALTVRAAEEIRTLSYLLHPPVLEEVGLVAAVRDYAEGFAKRSNIDVAVEADPAFGRLARGNGAGALPHRAGGPWQRPQALR